MTIALDEFVYQFGEIVLTGRRRGTRYQVTWYLNCSECGNRHMLRQAGSKVWHTSCEVSDIEWTLTPREVHISKQIDLTLILGEENGYR